LASTSDAPITGPLPAIWIASWHSRLVGTVFAIDAVVDLMEELVFLSKAHEPTPIRAEEPMCVMPHQAFKLMMQISRLDMSHEKKQLRKCVCNGVIAWSRQSRFKSNAVSEITGRWYCLGDSG
jgi:hypothetical protein